MFMYKPVDIVSLLILIITPKNDIAVLEYSCAKLILRLTFSRKVVNGPVLCTKIKKISSTYKKLRQLAAENWRLYYTYQL